MDRSSRTYQHYRFEFMFYVSLIALFFACLIIVMGIDRLFFDTIVNEQDLPLSRSEWLSLAIPTLIFGSTWLWSFGVIIYQMIMHKHPLSSSKEGLHHVLIVGIFLSFIIILPIKFIPIDHLYLDTNGLIPQLRIKKEVYHHYSWFIRLMIRLKGIKLSIMYTKNDQPFVDYLRSFVDEDSELGQILSKE